MANVNKAGDEFTAIGVCLGAAAETYARNKVRGGDNGRKGTRYEDFFAAYKVAELAARRIEGVDEWPKIKEQVRAFVDDLRIKAADSSHYFQLKNVAQLSWTSGDHPLQVDFELQKKLCDYLDEPGPHTVLVVSSKEVFDSMAAMPGSIGHHSSVALFPYGEGRFNRLLQEYAPLREMLAALSRVTEPTLDSLADVFGALIVGLMRQEGAETSMQDVVASARQLSPQLIRLFPADMAGFVLDDTFVNALARIDDLVYVTDRGFFQWSFYDMSGVLSFDCLSEEFARFQKRVVASAPVTFDQFEELL